MFLEHAGLTYDELVNLLDTKFAKEHGYPHISASNPCDTSTMTIVWGDSTRKHAFFDAAHRFVRLARRIGYSFRELDQAMTSSSSAVCEIDDDLLTKLAAIEDLRARFGLPVAVVASWFGPLERYQRWSSKDASYYDSLFQNKGIQNPLDPGLSSATPSGNLGDHAAGILAALHLSAADFALLTDTAVCEAQTGSAAPLSSSTAVSVDNLSKLHRHVTLARALKLSVRDLLILEALGGTACNPFEPATVGAFVDMVARIRGAGFAPADLLYLFAGRPLSSATVVPPRAAILATLDTLLAGLIKLRSQKAETPDLEGDKLKTLLAEMVSDSTTRNNIWALVDSDEPDEITESAFDDNMAAFCWDPETAKSKLIGSGTGVIAQKAARYGYVLAEMSMKQDGERLIQQTLGAALGIDAGVTDALLRTALTAASPVGAPLLDSFKFVPLPGAVPDPRSLAADRHAAQIAAYEHLDRAATIARRLDMNAAELALLAKPGTAPLPMFHMDALPRVASSPDTTRFAEWQTLVDVLAMRSTVAGGSAGLVAVLGALLDMTRDQTPSTFDADAVAQAISPTMGWPVADVVELLTKGYVQRIEALPHDAEKVGELLLWLRDAVAVVSRVGVSAQTAIEWIVAVPTPPATVFDATPIIQAAKAKHTEDEWTTVAPPLRDLIRDRQRNALVSYLMDDRGYTDTDQLFSDLYIDVQMAACQLTSRIKQAISSVQTFVQRALLHLEPKAKLTEEAAQEWSWRRSYRLWEANRKIFLYPENWIYPELRDDKSDLFQQLERELRQKDITDEVAEDAFIRYLEGLQEVANLEVVGMFHQNEASDGEHDAIDVLHVVGRTRLEPYKYFYRARVDASYWTGWEAIDLDIDADHLILAVMQRRLHLFWPVIETKADEQQPKASPNAQGPDARKHLEIRLAWSKYQNQKWTARRVSKGDPITLSPAVDPKWITFVLWKTDSIVCFLNPGHWLPWHRGLFRLGTFNVDACTGQVGNTNRDLTFKDPAADLAEVLALFERAQREEDIDPDQAEKDLSAAKKLIEAAVKSPGELYEHLQAEETTEYTLSLPALTVRVNQDDKQIPDGKIDDSMPDAHDKKTLTLPIVLDNGPVMTKVFGNTPTRFRVLAQHKVGDNRKDALKELPYFFYKDGYNTFFAARTLSADTQWVQGSQAHPGQTTEGSTISIRNSDLPLQLGSVSVMDWSIQPAEESLYAHTYTTKGYRFWTFYHPYACDYLSMLRRSGVAGLLQWPKNPAKKSVQFSSSDVFSSVSQYAPNASVVKKPYPIEEVDFSFGGAYALYDWEVFFHIPFLVATRLMQNQRFDEAQKWFHYIFDPTSGERRRHRSGSGR
ncbi:Insecticidal toxin complex protein TccB1 [Minicystis rosea]|nr:Insecticidal toxin complex protein TccB1 [Minicystis rosea]